MQLSNFCEGLALQCIHFVHWLIVIHLAFNERNNRIGNFTGVSIERVLTLEFRLMEILCMAYDVELRSVCRRGYGESRALIALIEKYVPPIKWVD